METDTDSLYLALAEEKMYDFMRIEEKQVWKLLHNKDCNDSSNADACSNLFPRTFCAKHRRHNKTEPGLFKEVFRCT